MPSDANGVYSLPPGYLAVTGETVQPSQHNSPLQDIAAGLTARLSANGANPMTGKLRGIDGTAGAPAFVFNTAQTTGWYKTGSGNIGFAIAGAETVEIGPTGIVKGARYIGEIFDWTGSTAPALCVLPYGQTLSRTAYPDLWDFAEAEIAAGNTLYNNGNGTTTFGVPDARGRFRATKDNLGGSAAGRLTSTTVSPDGNTLGGTGGTQTRTLVTANLPAYTPSGTITNGAITINHNTNSLAGNNNNNGGGGGAFAAMASAAASITASQGASTFIGNAQGGTSTAFGIVPPLLIVNCALFAGA
jgi:microcystin-dependent protein